MEEDLFQPGLLYYLDQRGNICIGLQPTVQE